MRDIIYTLLALAIVISAVTAPQNNSCGETYETTDAVIINLDTCDPDPELGVPSWVSILMRWFTSN